MALFSDTQTDDAVAQAQKALHIPIGMASPLWFTYAAFTGVGLAYWWMTRLAKPMNLEAYAFKLTKPVGEALEAAPLVVPPVGLPVEDIIPVELPNVPALVAASVAAVEPKPVVPEPVAAPVDPSAIAVEAVEMTAEAFDQAVGEAATTASIGPDDLTRLVGIGPTLAAKLADLGVKTFVDIASWTVDDLEKMDKALALKGRAVREGWVDQARQFTAQ